jgi:hypothetical protein
LNSLKMKSQGTVGIANKLFTMTVNTMNVGNGVHLHRHTLEIFAPNLKDQKIDFKDTILHNRSFHDDGKKPRG